MTSELKRIETTLERIAQTGSPRQVSEPMQPSPSNPSFSINPKSLKPSKSQSKLPVLPNLKDVGISSHHHSVNPALAVDLLQDISEIVLGWQQELKQVLGQIQLIYAEGPLIDGWLESEAQQAEPNFTEPSLAHLDGLMSYIEELTDENVSYQTPRPGYRLCGFDESGKPWTQNCPADEVPSVSLAIARYQKLRQLLIRKQNLETRLEGLTETLVMMRSSIMEH